MNRVTDLTTAVDIPVAEVVPHPEYTPLPSISNDIALVRLKTPVNYTRMYAKFM